MSRQINSQDSRRPVPAGAGAGRHLRPSQAAPKKRLPGGRAPKRQITEVPLPDVPSIEMKDMLEPNLPQYAANYAGVLSARQEFMEMSSKMDEERPKPGEFYRHQRFTHRLLREGGGRHFIIDEMGTGKSCSILGFVQACLDQNKRMKEGLPHDEKMSYIERAYILVGGKPQIEDIRQQLICTCAPNLYEIDEDDAVNAKDPDASVRRLVNNKVKRAGYFIMTYNDFRKRMTDRFGKNYIAMGNYLRGSFIWVDEGHNLIPATITHDLGHRSKGDAAREKTRSYQFFEDMFEEATHSTKIVISTATPLVNTVDETEHFFNLLLPKNGALTLKHGEEAADLEDDNPYKSEGGVPAGMDPYVFATQKIELPLDMELTDEDIDYSDRERVSKIVKKVRRHMVKNQVTGGDFIPLDKIKLMSETELFTLIIEEHTHAKQAEVWFPDLERASILDMSILDLNPYFVGKLSTFTGKTGRSDAAKKHATRKQKEAELKVRLSGMINYVRYIDTAASKKFMHNDLGLSVITAVKKKATDASNKRGAAAAKQRGVEFVPEKPTLVPNDYIWAVEMSVFQSVGFWRAVMRQTTDVYSTVRTASNLIFPDGNFSKGSSPERVELTALIRSNTRKGKKGLPVTPESLERIKELSATVEKEGARGYDLYVNTDGDRPRPTKYYREYLAAQDEQGFRYNAWQSSAKFFEMISLADESVGKSYFYEEYIESGAVQIGFYMEAFGYELYDEARSAFINEDSDVVTNPKYCTKGKKRKTIRPDLEKKPRYAEITADTKVSRITQIIQLMNSPENVLGEYIKMIVVTGPGKEGLSLYDFTDGFIVEPLWTPSSERQATARIFRTGGHDNLAAYYKSLHKGPDPYIPKDIAVRIYRMAVIPLPISDEWDEETSPYTAEEFDSIWSQLGIGREDSANEASTIKKKKPRDIHDDIEKYKYGIDVFMYDESFSKSKALGRVMRLLKRLSVGCNSHRERNILDSSHDYKPECDHLPCNYSCIGAPPMDGQGQIIVDREVYNLVYNKQRLAQIAVILSEVFRFRYEFNLMELMQIIISDGILPNYATVIQALYELISQQSPIADSLGRYGYIEEGADGETIVWRPFESALDIPREGLIAYHDMELQDVLRLDSRTKALDVIATLDSYPRRHKNRDIPSVFTDSMELLAKNTPYTRGYVLEHYVKEYLKTRGGEPSLPTAIVLDAFRHSLFSVSRPIEALQKSRMHKDVVVPRIGAVKLSAKEVEQVTAEMDVNKARNHPPVYLHILDALDSGQSLHGARERAIKGEGLIRVLDTAVETEWRSATSAEMRIYQPMIQVLIQQQMAKYSPAGFMVMRMPSGKMYFSTIDEDGVHTNAGCGDLTNHAIRVAENGGYSPWDKCHARALVDVMDEEESRAVGRSCEEIVGAELSRTNNLIDYQMTPLRLENFLSFGMEPPNSA